MAFKRINTTKSNIESPEALFGDLRSRKIEGLLSHQADMLRSYITVVDEPNVAFEMPTGSGKTLVGLLIGEWRRQQRNERVVYLCPTRQLVNQITYEAKDKYGITVHAFTGHKDEYDPKSIAAYKTCEAMAITTYNSLFNVGAFFHDANLIIMDDAHAAENYVGSGWSVQISRRKHSDEYFALISMFKDHIPMSFYEQLYSNDPSFINDVDKIPTPNLIDLAPQLIPFLDEQVKYIKELYFPWSRIRDNLFACHIYLSWTDILIRPIVPPTLTHHPFSCANQRIFMSATLGLGGDLERIIGLPKIARLPIQERWRKQGLGRRFFFFPELSLEKDTAIEQSSKLTEVTPRTLILVPNDRTAKEIKDLIESKTNNIVFQAGDIEESKDVFTKQDNAVAILANRFDGIDLLGDQCRLIILFNLPKAANLQERFLESRMAASVILKDRIRTRTVQAIGRCTRSDTDYSAVCVLGQELIDQLIRTENLQLYHPELQAEILFGIEQSKGADIDTFVDNFELFLQHDADWNVVEKDIVSLRENCQQENLPASDVLFNTVKHEVYYQYDLWEKNYKGALDNALKVIDQLQGTEVKGYRGFWCYLAANAAWLEYLEGSKEYEARARQFYEEASKCTGSVSWFRKLSKLNKTSYNEVLSSSDPYLPVLIERLESQIAKMGVDNRKFETLVTEIVSKLSSTEASQFEAGQVELGNLLGYKADNRTSSGAPDPWWIVDETLCIVFEDQSRGDGPISINKVRQVESHPLWIRDNVSLTEDAKIIPIMVTPGKVIDGNAVPIALTALYWHIDDFRKWANLAISTVRQLKNSFSNIGDIFWRTEAARLYKESGIDPDSITSSLVPLKSVPSVEIN